MSVSINGIRHDYCQWRSSSCLLFRVSVLSLFYQLVTFRRIQEPFTVTFSSCVLIYLLMFSKEQVTDRPKRHHFALIRDDVSHIWQTLIFRSCGCRVNAVFFWTSAMSAPEFSPIMPWNGKSSHLRYLVFCMPKTDLCLCSRSIKVYSL